MTAPVGHASFSDDGVEQERPIDGGALYWAWVQQRLSELEDEFTALLPDGYSARFDLTPVADG